MPFRHFSPLVFVACLLGPNPAQAAKLFGVVSQRSAAELAAGADHFARAYPGHQVVLRTPGQLAELTDAQLVALWEDADVVLFGAVFGDEVPRLERLLKDAPPRASTWVALHGDLRLTRQSRFSGKPLFSSRDDTALRALTAELGAAAELEKRVQALKATYPKHVDWLQARSYWSGRGIRNFAGLLAWLLAPFDSRIDAPAPSMTAAVRYLAEGEPVDAEALTARLRLERQRSVVAILDYDTGDQVGERAVHDRLCVHARRQGHACVSVLARWGEASANALAALPARLAPGRLTAVIVLQDFVVGGGPGRAAAEAAFAKLDVPVLKAIRLHDRSSRDWRASEDGIPRDGVHYRVAMPELQGLGQLSVVAAAGPTTHHNLTGVRITSTEPIEAEIRALLARVTRWQALQRKPNREKKVAIVYYNHPPGRHNIGADNLDVPASLFTSCVHCRRRAIAQGSYQRRRKPCSSCCRRRASTFLRTAVRWSRCANTSPPSTALHIKLTSTPYRSRHARGLSAVRSPR